MSMKTRGWTGTFAMVLMVFAAGAGEQFVSPDGKVQCAFAMTDEDDFRPPNDEAGLKKLRIENAKE